MPRTAKSPVTNSSTTRSKTRAKAGTAAKAPAKASASTKTNTRAPKAPVLKKAEVEAMLLSTQKKLHDAEVTLEAQEAELSALRRTTTEQQDAYDAMREDFYEAQVEKTLARHQRDEARASAATAIAEMRHLTQLLAEAEAAKVDPEEIAALRAELAAAKAALPDPKEISALRAQLKTAQATAKDVEALRKRVSEQDQRLQTQTREMADLTALLEQSEARQQDDRQSHKLDADTGRAAVAALITPPDTMRLDQERLNRAAAALVASGAFDPDWYLAQNADVAESGSDPALHFLEYGFAEGRAPRAAE